MAHFFPGLAEKFLDGCLAGINRPDGPQTGVIRIYSGFPPAQVGGEHESTLIASCRMTTPNEPAFLPAAVSAPGMLSPAVARARVDADGIVAVDANCFGGTIGVDNPAWFALTTWDGEEVLHGGRVDRLYAGFARMSIWRAGVGFAIVPTIAVEPGDRIRIANFNFPSLGLAISLRLYQGG